MANTNGGFGKIAISAAGKFEKKSSNYIHRGKALRKAFWTNYGLL